MIKNVLIDLENMANNVNGYNINSCEAAMKIVDSLAVKMDASNQQQCRSGMLSEGISSGYSGTRSECSNSTPEYVDDNTQKYNVAWEAIKKHSLLKSNDELAELFMNLTGTIIVNGDKTQIIPSKITETGFFDKLLYGGNLSVNKCQHKEQCLILSNQDYFFDRREAWVEKIGLQLISIQNKILSDTDLDPSEKELINKSTLPVFKIANILASYRKGGCPMDLYSVSELIALDMVTNYLKEVIDLVRKGCMGLKFQMACDAPIDEFLKNLNDVEQKLYQHNFQSHSRAQMEDLVMKKINMMEEYLSRSIKL